MLLQGENPQISPLNICMMKLVMLYFEVMVENSIQCPIKQFTKNGVVSTKTIPDFSFFNWNRFLRNDPKDGSTGESIW